MDRAPTEITPTEITPTDITRTDITVISADNPVKGWLYRPVTASDGAGPIDRPVPVIVMAHGLSAVKEMGLDRTAQVLARGGFAVVVFDHPCFGASGGTPRGEVDPDRQLRAYRDVITWAGGLDWIDADRVGVWGTSFSGGHAIVLAAGDRRVRAAVAQVPYIGPPGGDIPGELAAILVEDERSVRRGADPLTIPVTTESVDGGGALSPDPTAHGWFTSQAASVAPSWRNEITLKSLARLYGYRPIDVAPDVQAPVLLLAARQDRLIPFAQVEAAHAAMPEDCRLVALDGGHFDPYDRLFDRCSAEALEWFSRVLSPSG